MPPGLAPSMDAFPNLSQGLSALVTLPCSPSSSFFPLALPVIQLLFAALTQEETADHSGLSGLAQQEEMAACWL